MADTSSYWERFTQGRLSRRRALAGAASLGLGAAAVGLAGCGGGDSGSSASSGGTSEDEGTPRPGGIWRQATITLPTHFSPFHPGADPSFVNTWRRETGYYDRLWATREVTDPARQRYGRLAASWEVVGDGTTVIVKLNQAKFHNLPPVNGRPATAEDFVQTIEFLKKPPASGGSFIQSGKDLKSVTAVDVSTLRFEMNGPRAFFFEVNNGVNKTLVPKDMLDEQTLKTSPPVGTGPYMYKEHRQNSSEDVVRNPDYFLKDRPYLAGRSLVFLGDAAAIEAAFRANQIDDTAEAWQNVKQAEAVNRDLGNKVKALKNPSASGMAILLNIHRDPWKDARVREAVHRAIDIDRIINVVYLGDGERSWYFSNARPERFPIGRKAVEQYIGYDPKKSADLLRAAGADLSKTFEFMVPPEAQTWVDGGGLVAEDLAKVGIKTRINPVVRNIYLQRAGPKPGDFDITMTVYLDYQYMKTDSGTFWNNTSLEDPEVDALAEKIEATIDDQARAKLSNEIETLLARKYSPLVPMLSTNTHWSYYAYMKGINFEGSRSGQGSWQIDRWKDSA